MESHSPGELLRQANHYLERNDVRSAYPFVRRLAEIPGGDARSCVTAGLMALTLQLDDEAARHFEQAVHREPANFDANFNLALVEIQNGRLDRAGEVLNHLILCHPEKATLHNDLAIVLAEQGDHEQALAAWARALRFDPNYDQARRNLTDFAIVANLRPQALDILERNHSCEEIHAASRENIGNCRRRLEASPEDSQKVSIEPKLVRVAVGEVDGRIKGKKIAFFAAYASFLGDIVTSLGVDNDVRVIERPTPERIREMCAWADLAWFEWCDELLVTASKMPKQCPIVCRLHSYEAFTDLPSQVDWSRVDQLIFVNDSVRDLFERQVTCDTPRIVIPNGVDLDRFTIPQPKRYGKKIASVGYINYKKNPTLLLYCFKKIHQYDPQFSLHIAGEFQDSRIQIYFEDFLKKNPLPVHFDGWVDDMPNWYADKDFVISTSLFESFHYSIAEGMASGLMPLIHHWLGAENLYPEEFLFSDPDDCLTLVQRLEEVDRPALALQNRRHIGERFALQDCCDRVGRSLARVCAEQTAVTPTDKVRA